MKITGITTKEFRWPRHKPIANGKHTYTHVTFAVVEIATTEGITGIGLGGGGEIERATIARLTPMLIGEDPIDVERLWQKMWEPKLIGRRGLTTRAISAIDIGLWDIRAKFANLPLYKLLGGFRDRVPTYIAGGYYEEGKGLRELAREMEDNVRMGAKAVKMKVGAVPIAEDVARVRVAREAVGPNVKLMVDANCAYRYYEAIQLAKRIEEYDIFWFEEPVAPDDYDGHRKLAQATSIPIATGENEYTRYGFRDLIRHECAAILNADAKILGGVTEFMKVAALAQAQRSGHRAARLAGHPRAPCRGDIERTDPRVLPRYRRSDVGPRLSPHADAERRWHGQPAQRARHRRGSRTTTRWPNSASPDPGRNINMAKILVIHGAGMNMRGKVQTEIFGPMTLPEYDERIRGYANELGCGHRDLPLQHRRRGHQPALRRRTTTASTRRSSIPPDSRAAIRRWSPRSAR